MKGAVLDNPRNVTFRRAIASGALFSGKAPTWGCTYQDTQKTNEDFYSNPLKY
ncbi:hypothetical protein BN1012_Phect3100 [Candidatus Phaeomarinobacter ectocarpi]|uniref:Uncharacterized protein n=1 Tax=Candidatus Phaeomarinibacter ectocarpi TaxID=1458461 RepID=X5MF30_9HYPH|nr:hypothetical protein BN1012_Phect3100 [Candidatus Phaeomarinobacter ectocarpi]